MEISFIISLIDFSLSHFDERLMVNYERSTNLSINFWKFISISTLFKNINIGLSTIKVSSWKYIVVHRTCQPARWLSQTSTPNRISKVGKQTHTDPYSPPPITRTVTRVFPVKIVPEHLPLLFSGCKYGTKRLGDFLFSLFSKIYAFSAKKENVVR